LVEENNSLTFIINNLKNSLPTEVSTQKETMFIYIP
jgi:hypothetical protein